MLYNIKKEFEFKTGLSYFLDARNNKIECMKNSPKEMKYLIGEFRQRFEKYYGKEANILKIV